MIGKIRVMNQMEQLVTEHEFHNRISYLTTYAKLTELFPNHVLEITFKSRV